MSINNLCVVHPLSQRLTRSSHTGPRVNFEENLENPSAKQPSPGSPKVDEAYRKKVLSFLRLTVLLRCGCNGSTIQPTQKGVEDWLQAIGLELKPEKTKIREALVREALEGGKASKTINSTGQISKAIEGAPAL